MKANMLLWMLAVHLVPFVRARVVSNGTLDPTDGLKSESERLSTEKRASGRARCIAPYEGELKLRRDGIIQDGVLGANMFLLKRVMVMPTSLVGATMGQFMLDKIGDAAPIVWATGSRETATATLAQLGDQSLSFGVRHIVGCTVMFIISRKGVYVGHYWENLSFDPDVDAP
ncbi:hypothetical protein EJ08DRAFT_471811 [Tothia fuscella]|uniref:Uncharacterized protein n=1 Tax=Tothia fuscella TaxID=1048955 RepID=A0A9P4U338_9PEZI|nr:hypothetical protein EJ08DRAFT_471811 [Tothia fuscella]